MSNVILLLDWLEDHPGVNLTLSYNDSEEVWTISVKHPNEIPRRACFMVRDDALKHLIDILKGDGDGELSPMGEE